MRISKYKDYLFLALGGISTALLSFLLIGTRNYFYDEIATILVTRSFATMIHDFTYYEGNMWIYYLLMYFWLHLGTNEAIVRSLSAIFAIATIFPLFYLTKLLFDSKAARIVMLLFPVNIFFIQNAQNARSYSALLFLTTLSSYLFLQYIRTGVKKYVWMYILMSVFAVYAHVFALLVIATHFLSLVFLHKRNGWKRILIAIPIMLLFFLPLFSVPSAHGDQINWIAKPAIKNLIGTYIILSDDFPFIAFIDGLLLFWYFISFWRKKAYQKSCAETENYTYLLVWLFVPIGSSFLFSVFIKPVYLSMYFIICLVPFSVLVSLALARIKTQWVLTSITALLIVLSLIRLFGWYSGNNNLTLVIPNNNEDWRSAAQFLASHVQSTDAVLFFPSNAETCIDFYYQKIPSSLAITKLDLQPNHLVTGYNLPFNEKLLKRIPAQYSRIWYVSNQTTNPNNDYKRTLIENMLKTHYTQALQRSSFRINIFLYKKNT